MSILCNYTLYHNSDYGDQNYSNINYDNHSLINVYTGGMREACCSITSLFDARCALSSVLSIVCSWSGVRAVSYTHLDVYKRQVYHNPNGDDCQYQSARQPAIAVVE